MVEGVLNDLDVTGVHIHECALFSVLSAPSLETGLHKGNGVCELLSAGAVLNLNTLSLGLLKLAIVTLLELFLQVEDLVLKSELVNLMLSLESKNLVVGVLAEALAIVSASIESSDFLYLLIDLAAVDLVDARLVAKLLTPCINLLSKSLVL